MRKSCVRFVCLAFALFATPSCGAPSSWPGVRPAAAAALRAASVSEQEPARSFGSAADASLATLEHTVYQTPGRWNLCIPNTCGSAVRDWGADALTYTLFLRWKIAHDGSIRPLMSALAASAPSYRSCRLPACGTWSDIPLWDSIALAREFEITRDSDALMKARRAFAYVDDSNAFARGACPAIDYQRPSGGHTALKTLETDSNYIKAALLLQRWTGDRRYLDKAVRKYAAVRRYFLDPTIPLYSVYVFDDGRHCTPLTHRFYASVNGNMIYSGLALAALTGHAGYARDAFATARAVARNLNDDAGMYADLQADNDVVEPLVEAMYDLAAEHNSGFARDWLLANAAVAVPAANGAYGRFYDGPPPAAVVSAWSANGGFALAIAAGALAPGRPAPASHAWDTAYFVAHSISAVPSTIAFHGRAIALIGTIGDTCCEPGHVRVIVDGRETLDGTGIWQNKSPALHALPNSVLFSWRWARGGAHTITFAPGVANAKEGGSYIHLQGYRIVP